MFTKKKNNPKTTSCSLTASCPEAFLSSRASCVTPHARVGIALVTKAQLAVRFLHLSHSTTPPHRTDPASLSHNPSL